MADWKACTGRVVGGKLRPDVPTALIEDFRALEGEVVELMYRKVKVTRSTQQNRAWWGIVVATFMKETGEPDRQAMHEWILEQIGHVEIKVILGVEKKKVLPTRTLSKAKFARLYELAQNLGSLKGIDIPSPEAVEEDKQTLGGKAAWY